MVPVPHASAGDHLTKTRRRLDPTHLLTAVVFLWLTAVMLATIAVLASGVGMYEPLIIAELIALGILAITFVVWRRRQELSPEDRVVDRRHRERRGF